MTWRRKLNRMARRGECFGVKFLPVTVVDVEADAGLVEIICLNERKARSFHFEDHLLNEWKNTYIFRKQGQGSV
jgi:hypothetical protein